MLGAVRRRPWLYPVFLFNLSPTGRQFNRDCDFVHGISEEIIAKRKLTLVGNTLLQGGRQKLTLVGNALVQGGRQKLTLVGKAVIQGGRRILILVGAFVVEGG